LQVTYASLSTTTQSPSTQNLFLSGDGEMECALEYKEIPQLTDRTDISRGIAASLAPERNL